MNTSTLEDLARWLEERLPAAGGLPPGRLMRLVEQLSQREDLWRHLVRHDDRRRVYVRIYRDSVLDVWLICWTGSQDTGLHDHDISSGAVQVVDGALAEDRLVMGEPGLVTTRYGEGDGFCFDSSRIHDVRHAGLEPSVSIHLYSPPLERMGYYEVAEDGYLARRNAPASEELPLPV
jgi:hypothetical protein